MTSEEPFRNGQALFELDISPGLQSLKFRISLVCYSRLYLIRALLHLDKCASLTRTALISHASPKRLHCGNMLQKCHQWGSQVDASPHTLLFHFAVNVIPEIGPSAPNAIAAPDRRGKVVGLLDVVCAHEQKKGGVGSLQPIRPRALGRDLLGDVDGDSAV